MIAVRHMASILFGVLVAVALGLGASVVITRASSLPPVVAMVLGVTIVLMAAILAIAVLSVRS